MDDRGHGAEAQGSDVGGAAVEGADPHSADPVRLDVAGGVGTITLDSPANRNALSAAVRAGLELLANIAATQS